jgi:hypothetical protein
MSSGARHPAAALLGLALALVFAPAGANAHTRSQSFSTWDVRGQDVVAVFSAPSYEATRLVPLAPDATDLDALLRDHLASRIRVARGGAACPALAAPRSLAARTGLARVELRFVCSGAGALRISNDAFFEVAPSHVHYARVGIDGAPALELLFSDAHRERSAGGAAGEAQGDAASFAAYLELGIGHILAGADHVAFLLALLLLCRRLRDVLLLVTGFTLGHSLTLTLAVLGYVRPDVAVVEALIGFTIALVAAENVAVRLRTGRFALAAVAATGLVALASVHAATGVGLPAATSLGLALFVLAYLPLAADAAEALRLRPLLTLLFGLVHGFGFANVLLELGLARRHLALALFGFNLGVEVGQLAIVAALWFGARALARALSGTRVPALAFDALSAALCGLGIHWFVARALGS